MGLLVALGVGLGFGLSGGSSGNGLGALGPLQAPGPLGHSSFEGVPVPAAPPLASTSSAPGGRTVDGIRCQTTEQVLFHIHAHLAIFVNGRARQVPYGIGIPGARVVSTSSGPAVGSGSCFFWLHTHASDGVIHIESPVERTFTLGDLFDIWGQPLSSGQVGPARGSVVALLDGSRYLGDPRSIPLRAHALVQLDVGHPVVSPESTGFPSGL